MNVGVLRGGEGLINSITTVTEKVKYVLFITVVTEQVDR
jgi:hypothetical protein